MFKLFKKQNKNATQEKLTDEKGDDCPMCRVSPEIVEQLKQNNNQEKSKKSCCN